MKQLLLFLLVCFSIPGWAQAPEGHSPEFLAKKSMLEESYQKRIDTLAERVLGSESFLASSVDVEFSSPMKNQNESDGSTPGQLTYVPEQWDSYFAADEGSYVLKTLSVSIFLRSDVNAERESILKSSIEANFSRLNLKLKFVRGDAVALSEALGDGSRSPASESSELKSKFERMLPLLEKFALPVLVFLAVLLLTFGILKAFEKVSRGLGDSAQSIAGGMGRIGDALRSTGESKNSKNDLLEGLPKSVDRVVDEESFERVVMMFQKLVKGKREQLKQAFGELPDASLLHLVEFLPHLDPDLIVEIKGALGPRVEVFSLMDVEALPSRSQALDWMDALLKKIHALELVGVPKLLDQFSEEELYAIRQLQGQGLHDIFSSVLVDESSEIVKALPDILTKKQLEELFSRASPEVVSQYMGQMEGSLGESNVANISPEEISQLKSKLTVSLQSERESNPSTGQMKVIQSVLDLRNNMTLDEEIHKWSLFFAHSPKLKGLAEEEYWSLEMMAKVPESVMNPWFERLDNKLLASLLHFSQKAELGSLWARFESLLPTGMRKKIVMDGYRRIEEGVPRTELIQWSLAIRQNIEYLRVQHKQANLSC